MNCLWLILFMLCLIIIYKHSKVNDCCCSVSQLCPTLCDPMDCSTPCLSVPHHLRKFAQVHVHCISDAIQPSHPQTIFTYLLYLPNYFFLAFFLFCSRISKSVSHIMSFYSFVFRIVFFLYNQNPIISPNKIIISPVLKLCLFEAAFREDSTHAFICVRVSCFLNLL